VSASCCACINHWHPLDQPPEPQPCALDCCRLRGVALAGVAAGGVGAGGVGGAVIQAAHALVDVLVAVRSLPAAMCRQGAVQGSGAGLSAQCSGQQCKAALFARRC
jgi:hypothetical protein